MTAFLLGIFAGGMLVFIVTLAIRPHKSISKRILDLQRAEMGHPDLPNDKWGDY